jgi:hypothetical protein
MASARNARKALARGAADESLVLLWNEVEPARLAGDVATLRDIGRIAEQIRRDGDPAQQREAERLLETLRGLTEDETPARPATDALEFSVEPDATTLDGDAQEAGPPDEAEGTDGRLGRTSSLVWILLFLLIVIANALRGIGGD